MVLYEYLIEIIDIRLLDLLIFLSILIFVFLSFKILKIPYFIDPYGEKSESLINDPKAKNYSKKWRSNKIHEIIQKKDLKELISIVGEFGKGMRDTVEEALKEGFSVVVITGNILFCDSKSEVKRLINKYPNLNLYMHKERPIYHFSILGRKHLFLEIPHSAKQKDKISIGINNAYDKSIYEKLNYLNQVKQKCIQVNVENFDEIAAEVCYR